MSNRVSVVVPACNEAYLTKTVEDVLRKAAGDVEVIPVLQPREEGKPYEPAGWDDLLKRYRQIHQIVHWKPIGLRPAINEGVASAVSRGTKYIFKLDAHCMLDQGWDEVLKANCDDDWVVVPRRKRLDPETWSLKDVGKPDIDYHYLSFPSNPLDFGGAGLNGKVWTERIKARLGKPEFDIDDEMSSQGSGWFMHAKYFQRLELMDPVSYGSFWNEFQEIGLKCWLSGGRVVVNKLTSYAHWHKGKAGKGYRLEESLLQKGRSHTMLWPWNEAWSRQTLPFNWLIEKFWPVPTWPNNWEEVLYGERKPRLVGGSRINDVLKAIEGSIFDPRAKSVLVDTDGSAVVVLDENPPPIKGLDDNLSGLRILSATYGLLDTINECDVTEQVRSLVQNNTLDLVVTNAVLVPGKNPFRGKRKQLRITYAINGTQQTVERWEKDALIIGPVTAGTLSQYSVAKVETDDNLTKVERPQVEVTVTGEHLSVHDRLVRKFGISDRRLRAPMPIELIHFTRNDLAQLFNELGYRRGVEVGVAEGHYSEALCQSIPDLELMCVDPWHKYSDNPRSHSKEHQEFSLAETKRRMAPYPKTKLVQAYSMDAVRDVQPNSLDFAYIDGHHSFDYVIQDLVEWGKRVRSGGMMSGDDYYAMRWGGVVEAVDAYVKAHQISLWFLCSAPRSVDFFWVKP